MTEIIGANVLDIAHQGYMFGVEVDDVSPKEQRTITQKIRREMLEIFYGRNVTRGMKLS